MENKIICLIGKTSSGKDTLAKAMNKELNIPIAISTTTRDMRNGEQQDREYHFLSNEDFNKLDFIEKREYKVYNGDIWYYGYTTEEFNHENCIAIVDVEGFYSLRDYFGEGKVIPFYIYASEETLRKRLELRGDDPQEIDRRLEDDQKRFSKFINSRNYYQICNEFNLNWAIKDLKNILENIL